MSSEILTVTEAWKSAYPDVCAGILVMRNVSNPPEHPGLDAIRVELETDIRSRLADAERAAVRALQPIKAYNDHYKRFRKTYHVQLQLESVAFKGRPITRDSALVEALFMAELKNLLLTSGHDLDAISGQLTLDVATGTESYTGIGGKEQQPKAGDMMFTDCKGIISNIIYGPDRRTCITSGTSNLLVTIYGVSGISADAIERHLGDIERYVRIIAPGAEVELLLRFHRPQTIKLSTLTIIHWASLWVNSDWYEIVTSGQLCIGPLSLCDSNSRTGGPFFCLEIQDGWKLFRPPPWVDSWHVAIPPQHPYPLTFDSRLQPFQHRQKPCTNLK